MAPTTSDPLAGQHVIVMGAARQGRALGRWLPTVGARVTLTDSRPASALSDVLAEFEGTSVTLALGGHPLALLDDCDVLCVSGGVPLTIPFIQTALQRGIRVTNDAQLFLERCPAPVIGITGSAGKTTTTALTGAMCRAAGRTTYVGGNIGNVLLDVLPQIAPDDCVVMELSSFQLELMTTSPAIAAVLNVTPNHLDRHGTMDAYRAAKAHVYTHQQPTDTAVFGIDDPLARTMRAEAPGQTAAFSMREPAEVGAWLAGDVLHLAHAGKTHEIGPRSMIRLRGDHNVNNVLAASTLAAIRGVPLGAIRAAIQDFTGEEHRLEQVAEIDGVTWINDSIATAPERASAALRSFSEPLVLLAGGRDKNLPWAEFAALAVQTCRAVITFGEFGPQVAAHIAQAQAQASGGRLEHVHQVEDLPAAVAAARSLAQRGDVVLLSPGGTSYDAYQDFAARGQHFRDLVLGNT